MADPEGIDFSADRTRRATAHPRAVGAPLPRGGARRNPPSETGRGFTPSPVPPPGRALPSGDAPDAGDDHGFSLQRTLTSLRSALPFVQRLLPLLDGNIASTIANVLTQHPQKPTPQQASVAPVNLEPFQNSVADLQLQHSELRDQIAEQNTSLKKVEDRLEMVREATDRNTLEQQELMEDLKAIGNKVNIVAFAAIALLAVSILLNLILYLHIRRVLP